MPGGPTRPGRYAESVIWLVVVGPVLALGLLVWLAVGVYRKARAALRTTGDLRGRVDALAGEAAALAERLDAVDADPRLSSLRSE